MSTGYAGAILNIATKYGNQNAGGGGQSQYMNNSLLNPMMIGSRGISTKTRLKGIGSNLGGNLISADGKFQGGALGKMFGLGGGGDDEENGPPSLGELAQLAVDAQISNLPSILAAQREFGPQFAQAELDLINQMLPQQIGMEAYYGPELSRAQRATLGALRPDVVAGQDVINDFLKSENLLTPLEEQQFKQSSRAATSVRGLGESGFGALEEVRGLTDLRNQLKTQRLNIALQSAAQAPTQTGFQVAPKSVSPGRMVQNITPANIFGTGNAMIGAEANQPGSILGQLTGALGGSSLGGGSNLFSGLFGGNKGGGSSSVQNVSSPSFSGSYYNTTSQPIR